MSRSTANAFVADLTPHPLSDRAGDVMTAVEDPATAPFQASLFASGEAELAEARSTQRVRLDARCWVDHRPDWLRGADDLFVELQHALPWRHGRRNMYDRMVDDPRLTAQVEIDDPRLPDVVGSIVHSLSARYDRRFDKMFCNFYRSGADSVAWHPDRVGRHQIDPLVAIVSLGGPRTFRMRPRGGGKSRSFVLHSGDLLVMGGACQHRWEHSVPKQTRGAPRISLTFRHDAPEPSAPEPSAPEIRAPGPDSH